MSITQTIYARTTVSMTDLRRNPSGILEDVDALKEWRKLDGSMGVPLTQRAASVLPDIKMLRSVCIK